MVTEIQLSIVGIIILFIGYSKIKLRYLRRQESELRNQILYRRNTLNQERMRHNAQKRESSFSLESSLSLKEILMISNMNSKKEELEQTKQKISQLQKYTLKSLLGPVNHFFSSLTPADLVTLIASVITLIIAILEFIRP